MEYRVYFQPSIEKRATPFIVEVESLDQAKFVANAIANYTLHLHDNNLMRDDSNFVMVERRVLGKWITLDLLNEQDN